MAICKFEAYLVKYNLRITRFPFEWMNYLWVCFYLVPMIAYRGGMTISSVWIELENILYPSTVGVGLPKKTPISDYISSYGIKMRSFENETLGNLWFDLILYRIAFKRSVSKDTIVEEMKELYNDSSQNK